MVTASITASAPLSALLTGIAFLVPGQGAEQRTSGAEVRRHCAVLHDEAVAVLGVDPLEHLDAGTAFVQPALFLTTLARWSASGRPRPAFVAGHSLGEIAALVIAGALDEGDGLRLCLARGRLMQTACDQRPGGMLAVLRGDLEQARSLARAAGLTVANDNAPGQVVLSGALPALERAEGLARDTGVRIVRIAASGAFHSAAMAEAAHAFGAVLEDVRFAVTDAVVLSGRTALPFSDPSHELAAAITAPVRWRELLLALRSLGVDRFVDVGPGRVMTTLARRTLPGTAVAPLEHLEARSA